MRKRVHPEVGAVYERFNPSSGAMVPLTPALVLSVVGRRVKYLLLAHGTIKEGTFDGLWQRRPHSSADGPLIWKRFSS